MVNFLKQITLRNAIDCRGTGLHTGSKVTMTIGPGEVDSGIVFIRSDLSGSQAKIPASWRNVADSQLCTTLTNDEGVSVSTVEHLMAALVGSGIDNAVIEINGPEIPIMDGSAAPFVFLIECAGIQEQSALRRAIKIRKHVMVRENGSSASLTPGNGFSIGFQIDFPSPAVAQQELRIDNIERAFKTELSRARTFGFEREVTEMRAAGMLRGGSLDNAIIVGGDGVLNVDGLRYRDEFVRHKILDSIGDLYLAGNPIIGHFQGERSGHRLNNRLLHKLLSDPDAWSYVTLGSAAHSGLRAGAASEDFIEVEPVSIAATG
ncbi:MAG: UDP-3-O-acyl-N-acetylglucosamine deacetylase [Alphaproteobacteria bacterium]